MLPLESEEQQAFVQWLRTMGLRHHHSPNETGRTAEARRRAGRMKQQGTSAGFPDLLVIIPPSRSVDGRGFLLAIEMKRRTGGVVSPGQQAWVDALNQLDEAAVAAYVCMGAQEAINLMTKHLKRTTETTATF